MNALTYKVDPIAETVTGHGRAGQENWHFGYAQILGGGFDSIDKYERYLQSIGYIPLEPSPTPTLDKMEAAEQQLDALAVAVKAAVSTALPPVAGLTRSPDLQHTSHQVAHQHGSAYLHTKDGGSESLARRLSVG